MEKVRPWCGQPSDRGRLRNRTLNVILKFSILILTKRLQSNFSAVTKTLLGVRTQNQEPLIVAKISAHKYMTSLPMWVKRRHKIKLCKIFIY